MRYKEHGMGGGVFYDLVKSFPNIDWKHIRGKHDTNELGKK